MVDCVLEGHLFPEMGPLMMLALMESGQVMSICSHLTSALEHADILSFGC